MTFVFGFICGAICTVAFPRVYAFAGMLFAFGKSKWQSIKINKQ